MTKQPKANQTKVFCKVCGRKPGRYDSLCFGVHANCSNDLRVDEVFLFRVQDVRRPENVWYCVENGMRVIEDPQQWLTTIMQAKRWNKKQQKDTQS